MNTGTRIGKIISARNSTVSQKKQTFGFSLAFRAFRNMIFATRSVAVAMSSPILISLIIQHKKYLCCPFYL